MHGLSVGSNIIDFTSLKELQNLLHGLIFSFAGAVILSTDKLAVIVKFACANGVLHRFSRIARDDEVTGRRRI